MKCNVYFFQTMTKWGGFCMEINCMISLIFTWTGIHQCMDFLWTKLNLKRHHVKFNWSMFKVSQYPLNIHHRLIIDIQTLILFIIYFSSKILKPTRPQNMLMASDGIPRRLSAVNVNRRGSSQSLQNGNSISFDGLRTLTFFGRNLPNIHYIV